MNGCKNKMSRGATSVLLGALALLLVVPATYAQPNVVVSASYMGNPQVDQRVRGMVDIEILDGSRLRSVTWEQIAGAPARLIPLDDNAVRVRLANANAYRAHLIEILSELPIPPQPPVPPIDDEEYSGGLQNRWQVVGISPLALEEAETITLQVTVLTTSGEYKATVDVSVALPFGITTGLKNVPINQPVLLYGKEQNNYRWSFASRPFASDAVLQSANTRSPYFTPDAPGVYEVQVKDTAANMDVTLTIYAGTWRGVITGQTNDGVQIADSTCTNCHNGTIAPDQFTPWSATGHAYILTDNLNTSNHYGTNCFSCHTVGYDLKNANNGIDEAPDYADFLASDLLHGAAPGNWTTFLREFPEAAQKANIQCENCHGPQVIANDTSPAHGLSGVAVDDPRISLSADLCGSCHGEPLRHGRFQQWQLSGHANYELAIDEGQNGTCARCHTVNGFLEWVPVLLGQVPDKEPGDRVTVTWTEDETHPQTCVTCHDPHDVGTTTGVGTDAKIRITGKTAMLDAGFQANGVGSGAICMTCHNSRRGLRNDKTFAGIDDPDRASHPGPQADVLMGQNAFLVNTGVRGRHSFIHNTCVTCHMEATTPPEDLSYEGGGTNHTFYASGEVCAKCHTGIDFGNLESGFDAMIEDLGTAIAAKFRSVMAAQIAAGNTIDLNGTMLTDVSTIQRIELTEYHGRQAINVVLKNKKRIENVRLGDLIVVRPMPMGPAPFYSVSGEGLPKAFWNYGLLEADGSNGAHNPTWILNVLNESLDAVGATSSSRRLTQRDLVVGMKLK